MNYKSIAEKAREVEHENNTNEGATRVSCPVYDLYVGEYGNIFFGGAAFDDDRENVPGFLAESFGLSLIQAGFLADKSLGEGDLEKIHNSDTLPIVRVLPDGDVCLSSIGEQNFYAAQAIRSGLELL